MVLPTTHAVRSASWRLAPAIVVLFPASVAVRDGIYVPKGGPVDQFAASSAAPRASSDPPSSIDRAAGSAHVSFRHERRQVTRCTFLKEPNQHCEPTTRIVSSSAVLLLTPVPDERALSRSDPRKPQRVPLGGSEPTGVSIQLGTGIWDAEWQGQYVRTKLAVRNGEDFRVVLQSLAGECVLRSGKCRVATDRIENMIEAPVDHRVDP